MVCISILQEMRSSHWLFLTLSVRILPCGGKRWNYIECSSVHGTKNLVYGVYIKIHTVINGMLQDVTFLSWKDLHSILEYG